MGEHVKAGFRVVGLVQGVGFRWWTRRVATRLGLAGTVRNCHDGSVEVVVAGTSEAVRQMEEFLRSGPPGARVRELQRFEVQEDLPPQFQIVP